MNYVGQTNSEGQRHGQGTYIGRDGSKYVGQWHNDKRHGHGVETYGADQQYSG